ncbi:MAG TPA: adenylate/guanylate cyclase domain-containing protein [Burkholderiales bacterium]|nr:adenylate/guanylate cyclase domain-containing protein [Burkholderiales bacterium]
MPEFQNRTLICSVLFIDIVEYSRKPVVEQSYLKDRFNGLLSEALRGVALNDRIILDTGDGAAISFIGDPEDALFVATALRDEISRLADDGSQPQLSTRMGINLGPVRLVKDINGQPNIIGDGINVAQRVMTFAKPGQVLVSRSYYEIVSRLSEEASKLFSYEGARTDKHIREHEVYAVGAFPGARRRYEGAAGAVQYNGDAAASQRARAPGALNGLFSRPRIATVLAVFGILAVALAARAYRGSDEMTQPPVQSAAVSAKPAPASVETVPLPPIKGLPPEPQKAPPVDVQPAEAKGAPAADKTKAAETSAPREQIVVREAPPRQTGAAESTAVAIAAPPALVSFAVAPWGEVYVDGKMVGVSPPLQELELAPGRHRVELRNSGSQPHVMTVNARPGERVRIKHKFD